MATNVKPPSDGRQQPIPPKAPKKVPDGTSGGNEADIIQPTDEPLLSHYRSGTIKLEHDINVVTSDDIGPINAKPDTKEHSNTLKARTTPVNGTTIDYRATEPRTIY